LPSQFQACGGQYPKEKRNKIKSRGQECPPHTRTRHREQAALRLMEL
jgi:hypothetical protein